MNSRSVRDITDGEICEAAAKATVGEALRHLELTNTGSRYRWFRQRCEALEVPVPPRKSEFRVDETSIRASVTKSDLCEAIDKAAVRGEMLDALRLSRRRRNYDWLRAACEEHSLSLLPLRVHSGAQARVSDAEFNASLATGNISQALGFLGLQPDTGNYRWYKERCRMQDVEPPAGGRATSYQYDDEEVFVEHCAVPTTGSQLKKRLIKKFGWQDRCMNPACPNPEPVWAGVPLTIQLDHINGNSRDNRIENLRLLCPNCHSQTPTFSGRKTKERAKSKPTQVCPDCAGPMWKGATRCAGCNPPTRLRTPKIEWPDADLLVSMITSESVEYSSKQLGVSGNAIRKHLRTRHGLVVTRQGVLPAAS